MDVAFWQFSNHPPNNASVADAMIFIIMLNSTYTGPFPGPLLILMCWILFQGKNIHLLFFVPLVMICRMHPNMWRIIPPLLYSVTASGCFAL